MLKAKLPHLAWSTTASLAALAAGAAHAAPGGLLGDRSAVVGTAQASAPVQFEVFLPLRDKAGLHALLKAQQDPTSPSYHKWLTPADFAGRFGAAPASVAAVRASLAGAGFTVDAVHSSSLHVTGQVGTVNRAFATTVKTVTRADGVTHLVAQTALSLPAALQAQGAVVAAFSNRLPLHVNSQRVAVSGPANRSSDHGPYWFTDLRQAYEYPALNARMSNGKVVDGSGVNVAIVMSSDALDSDIAAAFAHEKFTTYSGRPAPKIVHTPVDGGCTGGTNCDAFLESSLDTQQVLGGAPGARVTLLNIPSLADSYIQDAYLRVVESNAFDVVSSSFGGCELFYTAAYNNGVDQTSVLKAYEQIFEQGNAEGVTWVASSGDDGGLSCPNAAYVTGQGTPAMVAGIQFPAASPAVVSVGGGNVVTTLGSGANPLNSAYVSENAYGDPDTTAYGLAGYWGATGGQSQVFAAPTYQSLVKSGSTARTVPDIGMQVGGCPGTATYCGPQRSAVFIYANGSLGGVIGTSVSAPEFAGALALYVQRKGRQGNLNTFLYQRGAAQTANSALTYYHPSIPGFDGKWDNTYPGGPYNYLYGNGAPRIRYLFDMTDLPAAGAPQTVSNP